MDRIIQGGNDSDAAPGGHQSTTAGSSGAPTAYKNDIFILYDEDDPGFVPLSPTGSSPGAPTDYTKDDSISYDKDDYGGEEFEPPSPAGSSPANDPDAAPGGRQSNTAGSSGAPTDYSKEIAIYYDSDDKEYVPPSLAGPSVPPLGQTQWGKNEKPDITQPLTEGWYKWGKTGGGCDIWSVHSGNALAYGYGVTKADINKARVRAINLLEQIPDDIWMSKPHSGNTSFDKDFVDRTRNERARVKQEFGFFRASHTPSGIRIPDEYHEGAYLQFWALARHSMQKAYNKKARKDNNSSSQEISSFGGRV